MEKDLTITFLNEHWDEFIELLSDMNTHDGNMPLMEQFPDHMREFAAVLYTLISSYQGRHKHTQSEQNIVMDTSVSANWVPDASFECCDADNRGLLEKAQNFRRCGHRHDEHAARSIIIKNGLFIVQPQQNKNKLNTAFKNLVDSVL